MGVPWSRAAGNGAVDWRQTGFGGGATGAERNHRRARQATPGTGVAVDLHHRLRSVAFCQHHFFRSARCHLRQGNATRDAPHQHGGVSASARAIAAFSPGAPDRRHHAGYRARRTGSVEPGWLSAVPDYPHGAGNPDGGRHPVHQTRLGVWRDYLDHAGGVYRLHHHHHRVAHPVRAARQYAGFRSLWPRH